MTEHEEDRNGPLSAVSALLDSAVFRYHTDFSMTASTFMARPHIPPPTWMPTGNRGFRVDVRRALIPLSLAVMCFLAFGVKVPGWVLLFAALVVPAFYAWSAVYVTRNMRPFETEFNARLTHGDVNGLWTLYRDARLLRLLAPSWVMLAKLGLILTLRGEFRSANGVLEEAYEMSPKSRRVDLLGPLARTKYELGDFESLQQIASQWKARSLFPGSAHVYLAAAYVEDPREDSEQARALLDEIQSGLPEREKALAASLRDRLGDPT